MYGHLTFSLVALVAALFAGLRAKARCEAGVPMVPGLGRTVNLLVGIQFTLGVLAFLSTVLRKTTEIPLWELIPTSAHQANGALLLGAAAALFACIRRFETPSSSADRASVHAAPVVG
jgi:heme A synthase